MFWEEIYLYLNKIYKNLSKHFNKRFTEKQKVGNKGEEIAAEYLRKKGYKILLRNWKYKNYELDIVCMDKNTLVFVEVRTRQNTDFHRIYESITYHKKQSLNAASKLYLRNLTKPPNTFRFDYILVEKPNTQNQKINHLIKVDIH